MIYVRSIFTGLFISQVLLAAAASAAPSSHDEQQMTTWTSHLLQDAAHARQDLLKNDKSAATKAVDDAMQLRAKIAQLAKTDHKSMTVPLYAELDDSSYLSQVAKQRSVSHATPSSSPAANGTTAPISAAPSSSAVAKGTIAPVTVTSNVAQVTYFAIDLNKTNARLNAAKMAMKNGNEQAAEDALGAIGTDLTAVTVTTDLPLLTARQDLGLAQLELAAKNYQAASANLSQASQALSRYTGLHSAGAKKLAADISAALAGANQSKAKSPQKVQSWWDDVKGWFAHPTL